MDLQVDRTVHNKPPGTNSPRVALKRSRRKATLETERKLMAGDTTQEACTT